MISELLDLDYLKFDKRIQCREKPIEINRCFPGRHKSRNEYCNFKVKSNN